MFNTIKHIYSHPLAKKKLATIYKFAYWQFSNIFNKDKRIFNWVNDSKLFVVKGETGVTGNYYNGLMEFDSMLFLLHFLKKEYIFIDIGANSGVYSILSSKVRGCKTTAFEPIDETFERLLNNVNLNGVSSKVNAIKKGVGSQVKELYFTNNVDTENKVSSIGGNNKSLVQMTTIDNEFDTDSGTYVLKIDVEGFEMEVLKGAKNLLNSGRITAIIIEQDSRYDHVDNFICSFGFSRIEYNPFNRKVKQVKELKGGNTIYVIDVQKTKSICLGSEKVVIHSAFNQAV
jgi:FkbM family methyltransferase